MNNITDVRFSTSCFPRIEMELERPALVFRKLFLKTIFCCFRRLVFLIIQISRHWDQSLFVGHVFLMCNCVCMDWGFSFLSEALSLSSFSTAGNSGNASYLVTLKDSMWWSLWSASSISVSHRVWCTHPLLKHVFCLHFIIGVMWLNSNLHDTDLFMSCNLLFSPLFSELN